MRPHRRQPIRLPHPWDSPGKNTGVGCHFLLQWSEKWKWNLSATLTLSNPMDCSLPGSSIHRIFKATALEWSAIAFSALWPWGLYNPWNSLGQNTGVYSLSLLQGIFPTQGWNPGLPHCRWILYQLSHKGNTTTLFLLRYNWHITLFNFKMFDLLTWLTLFFKMIMNIVFLTCLSYYIILTFFVIRTIKI